MEKIAAKIVECDLEKWGDSTSIRMYVDYGCQQSIHIPKETELSKMLEFFEVYKLADVVGKYCYVIMKTYNDINELQQFPCIGDMCLNLSTGEIISEFERTKKLEEKKEFEIELEEELAKIKLKQASPKLVRKSILELFQKLSTGKDSKGICKSEIFEWLNKDRWSYKNKIIEKEFDKLVKENKIIGWGNTRAKRYANARNYRKLCELSK